MPGRAEDAPLPPVDLVTLDLLPDPAWVSGAQPGIAYFNTAWLEMTGTIHPDDVESLDTSWTEAVKRGEPYDTQFRLRRHDGVYRWFMNKAVPVRDADGAISAWIGTATDIDEQKRAADGLRIVIEAAHAFAGTLDASVAMQRLADIAVDHLADWCGVYVYDAVGRLRPAAIAHKDPAKVRFVRQYLRR